jgi:hypothetical protein
MKTLLLTILFLCFALSVVALSQDARDPPAPRKTQATTRARPTTIMGTIQEDGDKLRFITDQRAWNVDNPETLKGHERAFRARKGSRLPGQGFNSPHRSEDAYRK